MEAHEPMEIEPDLPDDAEPERKTSTPGLPRRPALPVRTVIAPLVVAMPCPMVKNTGAPVLRMLSPAVMVRKPAAPLLPLPTVMLTCPPLPPVEADEPSEIEPVTPERMFLS